MATPMVQVRGGHSFRENPQVRVPRSQFNRSHGNKLTFDADYLVPIYVDEVYPGDTFTLQTRGFCRIFSPLKSPIMDNLYVDTFFFFVPNRLVWENWQKFCGEQVDPGDSIDYSIPVAASYIVGTGTVADYFGIPINLDTSVVELNTLPFRAYGLIYNEWFRDQNLVDSVGVAKDNGPDISTDAPRAVLKRAKRHDYFTSCLPWPQKQTDPVSAQFNVVGIGKEDQNFVTASQAVWETGATATTTYAQSALISDAGVGNQFYVKGTAASSGIPEIYAEVTINALRQAFQIQKLLERDARGGTRYVEIIKSHFGVTSPDFRLQRPEYLGGGSAFVNVNPVANTSPVDSTNAPSGVDEYQGKLAGVGTSGVRGGFAKSFVEHGYVIGLINVRADLTYSQGLDRMWSRSTRYDFYWPSLAMIGEQAVLNKEIWVSNVAATDDAVFGYQERYGELRRKHSLICGKFRPDATGALSEWHLSEDFATLPSLNQTFIESTTPMSRVQAVTTEPDFIADLWFDLKCARPMPLFGIPGMIDHL